MRQTIRSLAVEAGLPVGACVERLRAGGLVVGHGAQRLDGEGLSRARALLDLDARAATSPSGLQTVSPTPPRLLDESALLLRLLRPLRAKGKLGRNTTSTFELVYGHGVPDHQKAEARAFAEALLRDGCLEEKVSQGRRHVWLTEKGLRRLEAAEAVATA